MGNTDPAPPRRRPFVGGNWKMNTTAATGRTLVDAVAEAVARERLDSLVDIAVFPPFVTLQSTYTVLRDRSSSVVIGAQDVYFEKEGAFTGEVSAAMLKDVGAEIVLTGHSERRHVLGETDETVNRKTRAALEAGLRCVLCIGETLEQRQRGETDAINRRQLTAGLSGVPADQVARLIVAYEPVWAIGTGKTATAADAQDAHHKVRGVLGELYGVTVAAGVRIIYGGSCKPSNAVELMTQPDIDGGLIGGCSLKAEEFVTIVRAAAAGR